MGMGLKMFEASGFSVELFFFCDIFEAYLVWNFLLQGIACDIAPSQEG